MKRLDKSAVLTAYFFGAFNGVGMKTVGAGGVYSFAEIFVLCHMFIPLNYTYLDYSIYFKDKPC